MAEVVRRRRLRFLLLQGADLHARLALGLAVGLRTGGRDLAAAVAIIDAATAALVAARAKDLAEIAALVADNVAVAAEVVNMANRASVV